MAATRTQHEAPVIPATVAFVVGIVAFFSGLVLPEQGFVRHVVLAVVFGAVGLLAGLRTIRVSRRPSGARAVGWIGAVGGGLGLAMLLYQLLVIATHGVVPAPFWAPFLT